MLASTMKSKANELKMPMLIALIFVPLVLGSSDSIAGRCDLCLRESTGMEDIPGTGDVYEEKIPGTGTGWFDRPKYRLVREDPVQVKNNQMIVEIPVTLLQKDVEKIRYVCREDRIPRHLETTLAKHGLDRSAIKDEKDDTDLELRVTQDEVAAIDFALKMTVRFRPEKFVSLNLLEEEYYAGLYELVHGKPRQKSALKSSEKDFIVYQDYKDNNDLVKTLAENYYYVSTSVKDKYLKTTADNGKPIFVPYSKKDTPNDCLALDWKTDGSKSVERDLLSAEKAYEELTEMLRKHPADRIPNAKYGDFTWGKKWYFTPENLKEIERKIASLREKIRRQSNMYWENLINFKEAKHRVSTRHSSKGYKNNSKGNQL